jgi:hypothetical protein
VSTISILWLNIPRLYLPYCLLCVCKDLWSHSFMCWEYSWGMLCMLHLWFLIPRTTHKPHDDLRYKYTTTYSQLKKSLLHNKPDQRISEYNIYNMIDYTKVVSTILLSTCLQRSLVAQFHVLRVFLRYALHVASLISYTKNNSQTTWWPSIQIHNNLQSTQNL